MPVALEQLLAPGYLDGLEARPIEDLRRMRAECQEVETGLSLARRVVQGHLDIVGLEVLRRTEGSGPGEHGGLVERLPQVLADRTHVPGPGRPSFQMVPPEVDPAFESELGALVGDGTALDPCSLSEEELAHLVEGLTRLEVDVSARRRALFGRLDALQGELTRRYRNGDASVDTLLS